MFINEYSSNGHRYTVFRDVRQINKNSQLISDSYSSFLNSETVSVTTVTDAKALGASWALAKNTVTTQLKYSSTSKFPSSYGSSGFQLAILAILIPLKLGLKQKPH